MKIVIVHYHLKRGGVTTVLETCVPELIERGHQVTVLAGGPCLDSSSLAPYVQVCPELAYDDDLEIEGGGEKLAGILSSTASQNLGGLPDVWHFHNHHLGKNFKLTDAVRFLANQGTPLLLQIHDFPEDGRQVNFSCLKFAAENIGVTLSDYLYPIGNGANVHYGVLNSRDHQALGSGGLNRTHLHLIPNAVRLRDSERIAPSRVNDVRNKILKKGEERFFLYPTRSIRRKNIGEVVLWGLLSSLTGCPYHIGVTLKPENPDALAIYQNWKDWANELDLPISFELGLNEEFEFQELVSSCDGFLSTSVAEGFGLSFLEPWGYSKGIIGRDIPEITKDFTGNGIQFENSLYSSIPIPIAWLENKKIDFSEDFTRAVEQSFDAYDCSLELQQIGQTVQSITGDGFVDFARLSERHMNAVLATLRSDSDMMFELILKNLPELEQCHTIESNRDAVQSGYSPSQYAVNLESIYQSILNSTNEKVFTSPIDSRLVLGDYLDPKRFLFLCT